MGFQRVRMDVAHRMQKRFHLPLPGTNDTRIGMARRGHAEGGGEVEIFAAVSVPDVDAARAFPDDGPGPVRVYEGDVARLEIAELVEDVFGLVHCRS